MSIARQAKPLALKIAAEERFINQSKDYLAN
jgi:hypothetical protein